MKLVPLSDRVVLKPVSYTHLDVYKRLILYRAGTLGRRTDPCCDHTYKSRDGAVL